MESSILKPTKHDQQLSRKLLAVIRKQQPRLGFNDVNVVRLRIEDNEDSISVPKNIFALWLNILDCIEKGKGVSVIESAAFIGTQEAADILGISRPSIVQLIENGDIPCKMVGSHRRILITDLEHYQLRQKVLNSKKLRFGSEPPKQANLDL